LPLLDIFLMAGGLGMDAMSVCMGIGVNWHGPGQKFRMAWHMGLFQFFMPILGYLAGKQLADILRTWGAYIAAVMVFAVGAKMLVEAIKSHPGAPAEPADQSTDDKSPALPAPLAKKDPTRGWSLVALSVATSLDALVVGFSLGIQNRSGWDILWASVIIGLVAGAMAITGIVIGKRVGEVLGKKAEIVGAVFLMVLALSFLWL
jgi:putative Mn2+ efflux pump MntP